MRPADYDPSEPTPALRPIPIEENGEPLVEFTAEPYRLELDRPRFHYRREPFARQGLAERLVLARERLREQGYGLLIVECWRPPFIQRRMFRAVEAQFRPRYPNASPEELRKIVEMYSAPDDPEAPPPHTTGGAVDLWLAGPDGMPADLHTPFAWDAPASFDFAAKGLSREARSNRDRLAAALEEFGLTNYPSEYWHYSYGDQGWAYRGGHPAAVYGEIEPDGWKPNPEDDVDAPLEFTED